MDRVIELAEHFQMTLSYRQLGEGCGGLVFGQKDNVAKQATHGTAVAELNCSPALKTWEIDE